MLTSVESHSRKPTMVLIALIAGLLILSARGQITEVETEYGRIRGDYEPEYKLTGYYGIPFASPPINDLRFKPPVPPQPWNGTKDCSIDRFFHVCPQFHLEKKVYYGSEDCLYANIYVPEEAANTTLPVMFWIYGGGYTVGDGFEFGWYRGKHLAANRRVIVVEFNYRLGSLGFLSHPLLKQESSTTGNYGVQDQTRALEFVNRNIAAFGGDPKRLAIFGESAGAFSVCWHLVNPASRGLFSAAIMESGTCDSAEFFVSEPRGNLFSTYQITEAGCNPEDPDLLSCLRKVDAFQFFMAKSDWPANATLRPPLAPVMPWGPVIDGSDQGLPKRPLDMIREKNYAAVPLIIGTNKDEGTLFVGVIADVVPGAHFPMQDGDFELAMHHFFNDSTTQDVITHYPLTNYKDDDSRAAHVLRDYFFLCASRRVAKQLNVNGVASFLYQFSMPLDNWIDYQILGNYHTSELSFVFDNEWPPILHEFNAKEKTMAASFQSYWTSMAKHGHPNGDLSADQAVWLPYNDTGRSYMTMDVPTVLNSNLNGPTCDFWDTRYSKYYFDQ
eukprot:m.226724 g.226724  ORF g.226724 m.226724 type:complete len:556 (+) comp17315_c1_seq10:25-1692(+)